MNIISRWETKYDLDPESAQRLRQIVGRSLPVYEYIKGQPVTLVTSVYFDTDRLDFYKRASACRDDNVKIRVREYTYKKRDGQLVLLPYCYLEIKRRTRGYVTKRRLQVPKRLLDSLLEGRDIWDRMVASNGGIDTGQNRQIYWELRSILTLHEARPRSVVRYRRWVYQEKEWHLRITFDEGLTVFSPGRPLYGESDTLKVEKGTRDSRHSGRVIMEIKCQGENPEWLKRALADYLPRRISKFTTSINILIE